MISAKQARTLADSWIAAWNAHDLALILAHYTDDFEMTSPYIAERGFDACGTLKGKTAVSAYWAAALSKTPQLHFEPIRVLASISSVALYYRSTLAGRYAAEVFLLNPEGKIYRAFAHYADA